MKKSHGLKLTLPEVDSYKIYGTLLENSELWCKHGPCTPEIKIVGVNSHIFCIIFSPSGENLTPFNIVILCISRISIDKERRKRSFIACVACFPNST